MTNGSQRRTRSDIAILAVVLIVVIALVLWFFVGRSADEGRVEIEVPELPGNGGNR
jgi:hypothetical protein